MLCLDIETTPDPSMPPLIDGDRFPPPAYHALAVLGVLRWDDREQRPTELLTLTRGVDGDEALLLTRFATAMARSPTIVSWNGRGFDLPVLAIRCLAHGLALPNYYAAMRGTDYRYRFASTPHLDLADHLCDHGAAPRTSLDCAARLIGLPGKLGCDGGDVASMWAAGRSAEVAAYCAQDVVQTAFLWLRFDLLRERMTREEYVTRASRLWGFAAADERTAPVIARADRERVLLGAAVS